MKKRMFSLFLVLVLLLGVLPVSALAETGETTPDGYMVISFEMYDAETETVILLKEPTKVGFTGDDTGTTIAKRVLGDSNVNITDSGWITSFTIDEIEYNAESGNEAWNTNCASWSVYKNNAEDQVAIGGYKPSDGDVYRVILTTYDPSNNYAFPTMPHNLDALYWAMAEYNGDLSEASLFVQSDTAPTQGAIDAKAAELSSGGGEHRIFIDQRTVLVDKSQYPYACTSTLEVNKTKAAQGETVTVTTTVPSGYAFKEGTLKANGVALDPVSGQNNQYTFTMPDSHVSLTAEIEILETAKLDGAVFSYDEAGTDVIALTPSFSNGVTEYTLTLYDYRLPENTSKVYSNLQFGAGTSASWQYYMVYGGSGFYTPGPNSDQTVSGVAYGHAKANVASPGMTNNQKHKVDVTAAGGAPNAYYFHTIMLPTLSDLKIGENTVENFAPNSFAYTVTVPANTESINLTATAYDEDTYHVYFEGDTQSEDIAGISTELPLNNSGTTTIELVVDDDNGITSTYTVTVKSENSDEPAYSAQTVLDAIAAKFADSGIASDSNAPWLAADMAAYAKAFPDTANQLSAEQKQAYLNVLIPQVDAATKPSDLAKYIIALRAMGYDARNLTTADGQKVDAVKKLTDLVDAKDNAVVNQYTLPYVIIALRQGADYATAAQMAYLKESAVSTKAAWLNMQYGTDGATPMILALAPYCAEADIKTVVEEAVAAVKAKQAADGSVGNAASTALVMAAMAAVGEDCADVKAAGADQNLVDGLMTQVSDTGDGFKPTANTFATEQGFRGLTAWQLAQKATSGAAQVYDFTEMPAAPAAAQAANCPVRFSVVPAGAKVTVKQDGATVKATAGLFYDLPAGAYSYTATLKDYNDAAGTFTVTEAEAAGHTPKTVSVSLTSKPGASETEDLSIRVRVLTHDETACGGQWTYQNNADKFTALIDTTVTVKAGQTAFDAFALAMEKENVSYTEKTAGYISEIDGHEEFGHGSPNSGWQYMIGSTLPTVNCREYVFRSNAAMTWFYTDDYTREKDSEQWTGGSSGGAASKPSAGSGAAVTVKPAATADSRGEAKASVTEKALLDTVAQANTQQADAIVIAPEVRGEAGKVSVELPKTGVDSIARETSADLKVETAIAGITLPARSLRELTGRSGSKVTVSAETVDGAVRLEVAVDGKAVEQLSGGITAAVPVPSAGSDSVLVVVRADGTEAIVKKSVPDGGTVSGIVDGSCTVKVVDNAKPFADTANHWAKDAAAFVGARALFGGTAVNTFAPDAPMSRAMLATVLYRLEDASAAGGSAFADVPDDAWYTDAVAWAGGAGIVSGTGSGFDPDGHVTREQLAAMLCRYAKTLGLDTAASGDLSRFSDGARTSAWAEDAMQWAVGSGLISGKGDGTVDPAGTATRAEVAAIVQRMVRLMVL